MGFSHKTAIALLLAAALGATVGCGSKTTAPDARSALQKQLNRLTKGGAPGAILLSSVNGQTIKLVAGYSDVKTRAPMRPNLHLRIGSQTKTFVATAFLQLVGEGRLSLDDSVARFLPGLVPHGDGITIRELLNHTSGLFDYENDPRVRAPYLGGNLAYHWPPRTLVEIAVSHKPLFAPGTRYSYSNTNYILLGLIVEKVSGHALGEELRRRIFVPLRLEQTSFPTRPGIPAPYAHGYYVVGKPPAMDVSGISPYAWADGAIVSTVGNSAAFYRALLTGRLLKPALLKAMKTTIAEPPPIDFTGQRYGLGLERYETRCGVAWGHPGSFAGYIIWTWTSPSGNRQAALALNEQPESLPRAAFPKFARLLTDAFCRKSD